MIQACGPLAPAWLSTVVLTLSAGMSLAVRLGTLKSNPATWFRPEAIRQEIRLLSTVVVLLQWVIQLPICPLMWPPLAIPVALPRPSWKATTLEQALHCFRECASAPESIFQSMSEHEKSKPGWA